MTNRSERAERRQFGRRRTHNHGWVKLPGRPAVPCVIRNVSDGGALLVFDRSETLPFAFLLTIEGEDKTYGCEVRHHYGERVGVAFVDVALVNACIDAAAGTGTGSWICPRNTERLC